jgi:diguanylate cyclase (GGDEF)-like protein
LIGRQIFLSEEGLNLKVTASLGVACFPDDAQTKEQIIRLADEAMYLVKKNERNSIAVANQGMLV